MTLPREKLNLEVLAEADPWAPIATELGAVEDALYDAVAEPKWALTREHIESLRAAGATREAIQLYAETLFSPPAVVALMSDLDSYGVWEGDPA